MNMNNVFFPSVKMFFEAFEREYFGLWANQTFLSNKGRSNTESEWIGRLTFYFFAVTESVARLGIFVESPIKITIFGCKKKNGLQSDRTRHDN